MGSTGEPGGEPMKTGVALVDVLAGKDAVVGTSRPCGTGIEPAPASTLRSAFCRACSRRW